MKPRIGYGATALILVAALLVGLFGVLAAPGTGYAHPHPKSIYLVADHHASPTPIQAYNIGAGGACDLTYQNTYNVTSWVLGASGLAMYEDPNGDGNFTDAQILVTYERSGKIEVFKATDFSYVNTINTTATDLAGIVVDQEKKLVYTVDRWTTKLYVFDANTFANTANHTLSGTSGPGYPGGVVGLALDETNDLLYVTDFDPTIQCYDTATFSLQDTLTTASTKAIGIAVDETLGFVYTGGAWWPDNVLAKLDLSDNSTSSLDLSVNVTDMGAMGLAVDIKSHALYVTTGYEGNDLRVFDSNLNLLCTQSLVAGGVTSPNPAGIVIPREEIAYNPLHLTKDDGVATCVDPGDNITYTICYDNTLNTYNVTGVTITDNLSSDVSFVSATGGGIYNGGTHSVTWDIGNMTAGSAGGCETLVVQVKAGTAPGTTIDNICSIVSDQTPVTTVHEYTLVCVPPVPIVGGEVYPVNKLAILAPWLALAAALIPAIIVMRRRRARS